jgi:hypothetical protein
MRKRFSLSAGDGLTKYKELESGLEKESDMKTSTIGIIILMTVGFAGCFGVEEGDTDTDSNTDTDTDTDSDTDTEDLWSWGDPIAESCSFDIDPLPLLVSAGDIGEGVRFTAVGHRSVLAIRESSEGDSVILYAMVEQGGTDPWQVEDWAVDAAGQAELSVSDVDSVRAVGVDGDIFDSYDFEEVALICQGEDCSLYGSNVVAGQTTELVPIENGEVPCGPDIQGMFILGEQICAYGSGVCCFEIGSWITYIDYIADWPLLNDVSTSINPMNQSLRVMGVGDMGRVVMDGLPDWFGVIDEYAGINYLAVVIDYTDSLCAANGGLLIRNPTGANEIFTAADEDIVVLDRLNDGYYHAPKLAGATASGRIFVGKGPLSALTELCYTGQVVGPVLGAETDYGHLVLTETALYGIAWYVWE